MEKQVFGQVVEGQKIVDSIEKNDIINEIKIIRKGSEADNFNAPVLFGPEPEFFLFDDVRYDSKEGGCFYSVDTIEAPWNTGRIEEGGNLGYKIQRK